VFAQVLLNSMWDIYKSDCALLVRSEWDTKSPVPIAYVEHQSYHEGKIIVDKVINSLCWHPSWTGIAMVAYTQHATNDYLIGPKTYDEVHRQHSACRFETCTSFKEPVISLRRLIITLHPILRNKRVALPIEVVLRVIHMCAHKKRSKQIACWCAGTPSLPGQ